MNNLLKQSCLFYSVAFGTLMLGNRLALAESCMASDCTALGFVKDAAACEKFLSLRCPYDMNKYYCNGVPCGDDFKYTCTENGEAYGIGNKCDGKYSECNCLSGYYRQDGSCQKCDSRFIKCENGYSGDGLQCGGLYEKCICASGKCKLSDGTCGACPADDPINPSSATVKASMNYSVYLTYNYDPGSVSNGIWITDQSDKTIVNTSASASVGHNTTKDIVSEVPNGQYKLYINNTTISSTTAVGQTCCGVNKVIFNGICYENSPGSSSLFGCNSVNAQKLLSPLSVEINNRSTNLIQIYGTCSRCRV